jgi:hypothetical protein
VKKGEKIPTIESAILCDMSHLSNFDFSTFGT